MFTHFLKMHQSRSSYFHTPCSAEVKRNLNSFALNKLRCSFLYVMRTQKRVTQMGSASPWGHQRASSSSHPSSPLSFSVCCLGITYTMQLHLQHNDSVPSKKKYKNSCNLGLPPFKALSGKPHLSTCAYAYVSSTSTMSHGYPIGKEDWECGFPSLSYWPPYQNWVKSAKQKWRMDNIRKATSGLASFAGAQNTYLSLSTNAALLTHTENYNNQEMSSRLPLIYVCSVYEDFL